MKRIFHVGILTILLSNGNIYSVLNQNKPQNKYAWYFALSQEPPASGGGKGTILTFSNCLIFLSSSVSKTTASSD